MGAAQCQGIDVLTISLARRRIIVKRIIFGFMMMLGLLGLITGYGTAVASAHGKVLVAYFSRVDEN